MPANFDGTNDSITLSIGACGTAGPFTFAALCLATSFSATDRAIVGVGAGSTATAWLVFSGTTGKVGYYTNGGGTVVGSSALSTGTWYVVAASKATGTATPRIHYHDMTSPGTWTHENASGSLPNGSSASGGSIKIGEDTGGNKDYNGDIACIAIWNRSLSDDEVEKLEGSLLAWGELNPDCWAILDQDTTTQKVVDISGNGSNESARAGSTVSTLSAPIGWGDDVSMVERIYSVNQTVTSVVAAATAVASVPAVNYSGSVAAVAATATADAKNPSPNVAVIALVSQAIADALAPAVTATGAPQNVTSVAASASASANAPSPNVAEASVAASATASATSPSPNIGEESVAATASAAANAPVLNRSGSIASTAATSSADAKSPSPNVGVTATAAVATAGATSPGISQSMSSQPATATASARIPGLSNAIVSAAATATGEALSPEFVVIQIAVIARYAPIAEANATYAPTASGDGRFASSSEADARHAPTVAAVAVFAPTASGVALQSSTTETAQHAPIAEGQAVYG